MEFTFSISYIENTYFRDFGVTVKRGVKFDFFENGELTGTLIDANLQAIGLFRNASKIISERDQSFWEASHNFKLTKEDGTPFAWGEVDNGHVVTFPDNEGCYWMDISTHRFSKEKYRHTYNFIMNEKVHCLVQYKPIPQEGNWFRRNFGCLEEKGFIQLNDELSREYLFGFMLLITRQIAHQAATSSS